ncbi:MAG: HD domain-containing phosphohydrolase [Desulfobacterales bacterium]
MDSGYKIVVVDDEKIILDIFKEYLESTTNHEILTAGNGYEALDIIKSQAVDCCFTDISMPDLDGIELAGKIHEYDNSIPVVVMTGYPSMENAVETLKNGVVDFLTKPIKMDKVLFTIERIMRDRSVLIDNIFLKEEAKKNEQLLKINTELQEKIREVEVMNLILQELDKATTSKELFNILVNLSGKVTECNETHFCLYSEEARDYAILASFFRGNDKILPGPGCVDKTIIEKVTEDGMPLLIRGNNGSGSTMAIPLKIRSKAFGVLVSSKRSETGVFDERDLYIMNFLSGKASVIIENLALYENIYENLFSTLYAFVDTIEARDPYTKQHSARVSGYATAIAEAKECSEEELEKLNVSGVLHDIGKIGIPDYILLKDGKLTDEEYEIIKTHPTIGDSIIGRLGMWTAEQRIIRHHHERYDGNGYPDGLKREEIPLLSRILAVADTFDALTSDRSYRKRMSDEVAIKTIEENRGSQFDPEIADIFIELNQRGVIRSEPVSPTKERPPVSSQESVLLQ